MEVERRFYRTFRGRPRFRGPEVEGAAAGTAAVAAAGAEGCATASLFLLPGGLPRRRFTGWVSCGEVVSKRV